MNYPVNDSQILEDLNAFLENTKISVESQNKKKKNNSTNKNNKSKS